MVQLANEQTLRQINAAISRTLASVPPTANPSAELAKQASAEGVPPGFIDHLTQVFNVHRSLQFFDKQADRRHEMFELADPEKVRSGWGVVSKEASIFDRPTPGDFAPLKISRPEQVELALWEKMAGETDACDRTVYHRCEKLAREIEMERKRITTKRAHLRLQLEAGVEDLCRSFRAPYGDPFDTVEERTLYKYGSDAAPLLDLVWDLGQLDRFGCKRGCAPRSPRVFPIDRQPYPKIAALMELIGQLADHDAFAERQNATMDKAAADLSKIMMGGILGKQIGGKSEDVAESPDVTLKPSVESELRNIQVSKMLTDAVNNDPVISTYPAEQVTQIFNQISNHYPRLAMNGPVAMEILRKRLQQAGGLDVFEGGKMLEQEDTLRKQELGLPGK